MKIIHNAKDFKKAFDDNLSFVKNMVESSDKIILQSKLRFIITNYKFFANKFKTSSFRAVICTECGIVSPLTYSPNIVEELIEKCLCLSCNNIVNVMDKHDKILIGHKLYTLGGENTRYEYRGHYGKVFNILTNNGEIIRTSNLWNNGEILKRYHNLFEVNGEFIESEEVSVES